MTGPTGGLLAMAGAGCGGATMLACGRGCGMTIRRGALAAGCAGVAAAGEAATTGRGGTAAAGLEAGGATTAVGRGGAAWIAAVSACLRSRIALRASPGLETFDRSNFGL